MLFRSEPGFVQKMNDMSFDPVLLGGAEFARIMAVEKTQWAAVIKATGVSAKK